MMNLRHPLRTSGAILCVALCASAVLIVGSRDGVKAQESKGTANVPRFQWDSTWPQPLPDNMIMGQIGSVIVDSKDRIWISQDTDILSKESGERIGSGWVRNFGTPAPPLLEFDQAGKLLRMFGGPNANFRSNTARGLSVDGKGNIWVGGVGPDDLKATDDQVIKLGPDGKFLMQIGRAGQSKGSNDTKNIKNPGGEMVVDDAANEVYVADGYSNKRVIVFDATTGAYKRHWGAYGNPPDDSYKMGPTNTSADPYLRNPKDPLPKHFNMVTCVRMAKDGLVYVCDRDHGRLQVFRKDGTFVQEFVYAPRDVADVVFSPDQVHMYFGDLVHDRVWIARRSDGVILGSFGTPGRYGGNVNHPHNLAIDSKGNLYVGETWAGRRVQRFLFKGLGFANVSETIPPPQYPGRVPKLGAGSQ